MCGICGIRSRDAPPDVDVIRRMVRTLNHRGPDGSAYFRDRDVALGHTRLSIIDAVGGRQPMTNEDDQVWVSFNGEIFNYVELTNQLRALGHRFRTRSDTEVIVHAWEQWGFDAFSRFNGQWALAIWDRRTRELVLSRDRVGIHPLFYTQLADRVLFASEVKALFTDPGVEREFDPDGVDEVLTFWSTVAPRTVFRGIHQVPPGEALIFGDTATRTHRYWTPSFPSEPAGLATDVDASAAALREALIEATRLRFLRSDVPVAAYLSGGIDSAVTAGIISRYTDSEVHTYSLRFADAAFDEGDYQRLASERLGSSHHEITVTAQDIAAVFPEVIRHAETPVLRAAPAPMHLLSRFVHDSGHRVVVTGEGADETLAGYDVFREAAVRRFMARDPDSELRARAVELLYPWMERSPNQAPAFARRFFSRNLDLDDPFSSHRPRWDSTTPLKSMLEPSFAERSSADAVLDLAERMPTDAAAWHPLARAQWLEATTLLPGYILASQGDRMLMAHSVEGRFPFLDPVVTDLANSLPARHKLLGLDEKHVLKRAFADLVPAEIVRRPKQPYRSPDAASFFAGGASDWVHEALNPEALAAAGVFQPEIVQRLAAKAARAGERAMGNSDNMRFMAVLSTQLLYLDMMVGKRPAEGDPGNPVVVFDELTGEQ